MDFLGKFKTAAEHIPFNVHHQTISNNINKQVWPWNINVKQHQPTTRQAYSWEKIWGEFCSMVLETTAHKHHHHVIINRYSIMANHMAAKQHHYATLTKQQNQTKS